MKWRNKRLKRIKEIIIATQFFALILIFMSIMSYIQPDNFADVFNKYVIIISPFFTIILIFSIVYFEKTFQNDSREEKIVNYSTILNIILFAMVATLVYSTRQEGTLIEFLYLLPVITISISNGLYYGFFLASLVSLNILVHHHIILASETPIDTKLIFIGTLFLTAWLSGSFAELERKTRAHLETLVNIDELTGLSNHRHFHEVLRNVCDNPETASNTSLIFADIDYFRYYNDKCGYIKGDMVLEKIGNIIKKNIPSDCIAARYGGDEFAIILPGYSMEQAEEIAKNIREEVEETNFFGETQLPHSSLTLSLGIASSSQDAQKPKELIGAADKALYNAKHTAKNKITFYFSVLNDICQSTDGEKHNIKNTIMTLLTIIDTKDKYTYGHSERVAKYALEVAEYMNLNEEEQEKIKLSALLHDLGKIEIDKNILKKPEKLNDEEWEIMKKHPTYGSEIAHALSYIYDCSEIISCHHENIDGSGYPRGIEGQDIPLGARLLRIVDSFDAMTSERPYRPALSTEKALNELYKHKGIFYDPEILEAFSNKIRISAS